MELLVFDHLSSFLFSPPMPVIEKGYPNGFCQETSSTDIKKVQYGFQKMTVHLFNGKIKGHSTDLAKETKYGYRKGRSTDCNKGAVRLSRVVEKSLAFDSTASDNRPESRLLK